LNQDALRGLLYEDVVAAAPALLGGILVWGEMRARIVETEAYRGEDDPACHAFGRTSMRNMNLFASPGTAYVYFNYGVHWMLNIVAHEEGRAAAVLIRAAQPLAGLEYMRDRRPVARDRDLLSGPGKLCHAYGISGQQNGIDLLAAGDGLRILASQAPATNVVATPRIGIAEGKWHDVPWRFVDGDRMDWVSRGRPKRVAPSSADPFPRPPR
jgi:DNA-3-methyladenine glycosylase